MITQPVTANPAVFYVPVANCAHRRKRVCQHCRHSFTSQMAYTAAGPRAPTYDIPAGSAAPVQAAYTTPCCRQRHGGPISLLVGAAVSGIGWSVQKAKEHQQKKQMARSNRALDQLEGVSSSSSRESLDHEGQRHEYLGADEKKSMREDALPNEPLPRYTVRDRPEY